MITDRTGEVEIHVDVDMKHSFRTNDSLTIFQSEKLFMTHFSSEADKVCCLTLSKQAIYFR